MGKYRKIAEELWNEYKNDKPSSYLGLEDLDLCINVYGFNVVVKLELDGEIETMSCYANDKIHPILQITEFLKKHIVWG